MKKNTGIYILILCFILANVNTSWANQLPAPVPVIPPNELQALNQELIDRDRLNQQEEASISNLIEENNQLKAKLSKK